MTNVPINGLLGWCFGPNFEFAPGFALQSISAGGESIIQVSGIANFIYNFSSSGGSTIPFIQGGLGYGTTSLGGESIKNSIIPAITGGVRVIVDNSASVNFAAFHEHTSTSETGFSSVTGNTFGLNVGLSIFPTTLRQSRPCRPAERPRS